MLAEALRLVTAHGTAAVAVLLARSGGPSPGRVMVAGDGRPAFGAVVGVLVPVGGRLGVESLTYPVVMALVRGADRRRGDPCVAHRPACGADRGVVCGPSADVEPGRARALGYGVG